MLQVNFDVDNVLQGAKHFRRIVFISNIVQNIDTKMTLNENIIWSIELILIK